jgi:hypothetical protein
MAQSKPQLWMSIFSGTDQRSLQLDRTGYQRKPNGSQDQGQKDEND